MTAEEFIKRMRIAVYDSAIKGAVSLLQRPPGRRPSAGLVELSEWFNRLSPEDNERTREAMQLAVRAAVFGVLTMLDGVTAVSEAGEEKGCFELRYSTKGRSVLLNDPKAEPLHDVFGALVPPL